MTMIILALAIFGFASCGRLDSSYLPPLQRGFGFGSAAFSGSSSAFGAGAHPSAGAYSGAGAYAGSYSGAGSNIPILRQDDNNNGDGTYNYAYETGNGISAQEQGDARGDGTRAHGGFSYTAPDGQHVLLQYTADENGFVPQGSHVPTPHPIPEEIRKSVEQNLADEARGIVDDGQYRDQQYAGDYRGQEQYRGQYRTQTAGQFAGFGQYHGQGYKY